VAREKSAIVFHHAFPDASPHLEVGDAGDGEAQGPDAPLGRQGGALGRRGAPFACVPSEHRPDERLIQVRAVAPCERRHHQIVRPRAVARALEIEQGHRLAVLPEDVVAEQVAVDDAVRQIGVSRLLGASEPIEEPRRQLAELPVFGLGDALEADFEVADPKAPGPRLGKGSAGAVDLGELRADLLGHLGRDARLTQDLAIPPWEKGDGARAAFGVERRREPLAVRAWQRPRRGHAAPGEMVQKAGLALGPRPILLFVDPSEEHRSVA
jgi:hypothetical protein